jgi:hypothetical protein
MVTWPSPASTTLPLRRTHRIVVDRILFVIGTGKLPLGPRQLLRATRIFISSQALGKAAEVPSLSGTLNLGS